MKSTQTIRYSKYDLVLEMATTPLSTINITVRQLDDQRVFQAAVNNFSVSKSTMDKIGNIDNFYLYLQDRDNSEYDEIKKLLIIKLVVKVAGKILSSTKLEEIRLTEAILSKSPQEIVKICIGNEKISDQTLKQILRGLAEGLLSKQPSKPNISRQDHSTEIKQHRDKLNELLVYTNTLESSFVIVKSQMQSLKKEILNMKSNPDDALLLQINKRISHNMEVEKNKILEQTNYNIGALQAELKSIREGFGRNLSASGKSASTEQKVNTLNQHENVFNKNHGQSAPLNPNGKQQTSLNNIDQIHHLILEKTKKTLKKNSKNEALRKVNKKDNFFSYFAFEDYGGLRFIGNRKTIMFSEMRMLFNSTFSIKITKTEHRNIGFGIADSLYAKQSVMRQPQTRPNLIYYQAQSGKIFDGPNYVGKQNIGINQGEIVTMYVNLELGLIAWVVKGEIRANYISPKVVDSRVHWMPMVIFSQYDDAIEFYEEDIL